MKKIFSSLLVSILLVCGSSAYAQIAITEFLANPASQDTLGAEWIELFNYSAAPVNIYGWLLYDADNDSIALDTVPLNPINSQMNFTIPSGGYAILTDKKTVFQNAWLNGVVDPRVIEFDMYNNLGTASFFNLGNGDDELILKNPTTGVVSWSLAYPNPTGLNINARACFLEYATNFATAPQPWGVKGAAGIIINGPDNVAGSPVGYSGNNYVTDALMQIKVNGNGGTNTDYASPLLGTYAPLSPISDIGVLSITAPVSGPNLTATEPVTVTVKNYGSAAVSSFTVTYQLNGGTPVTETVSKTIVGGGATASYTFTATANLAAFPSNTLKAYTALSGDVAASNDTATASIVNPQSVTDLGVTAVTAPVSGTGLSATQPVTVTIHNAGNVAVNSYNVSFKVNNGTPVTETISTPIAAGANATYTFTATANLSAFQTYTVCAYTTVAGDASAANDTSCAGVVNSAPPTEDLSILAITSPVSGIGLSAAEQVTIEVKNVGATTIAAYGIAYVMNAGAPVSQVIFTPLLPGATAIHTFTTPANLSAPGTYVIQAGATSSGDQNHLNDSLTITVVNTAIVNDLQVNAIYLPASSYTLTNAETVAIKLTNSGNVSAANFSVSYTVNGGAAVTETYTGTLAPGAVDTFTFATLADFSAYDTFDVCGSVTLSGDATPANNTACGMTIHRQPYTGPNTLAVTEIFNDPLGVDNAREFVEIYNYGSQPIDLKDWKLRDADTDSAWISHNVSTILAPGAYAVLCQNKDSLQTHYFGGTAQANILTYTSASPMVWALSNTSDEVMLKNPDGLVVWNAAYAEDDVPGRATFLEYSWNFASGITTFGSKATPGIVRNGNDLITPASLGYQGNSFSPDADSIVAINGNVASPLRGSYMPLIGMNAGVTAITNPVSGTSLSAAEAVTITVQNFGVDTLTSIPVAFTVNNNAPVIETFSGTLHPGTSATYTFTGTANLAGAGAYIIVAYTDLSGETNRSNDTANVTVVNTVPGDDAAVTALLNPASGIGLGQETVTVTVENKGTTPLSNIPVGLYVNGVSVSTEVIPGPLAAGASTSFTFSQTANLSVPGQYGITVFTAVVGDVNTANDTLQVKVDHIQAVTDIAVTGITAPAGNQPYSAAEDVTVTVQNLGNVDVSGFPLTYTYSGGTISESFSGTLTPGQTASYTFTGKANLNAAGSYTIEVVAGAAGDNNAANDTARVTVISTTGVDAASSLSLSIAPNPAKDMITIRLDQATNSPVVLALYDMAGKQVAAKTYSPSDAFEAVLDVANLPAGVYTLTVNSGLHSAIRKVVIE